ncbi:MAG: patatin-like phospholipase family protein [Pseudomonadota bacterium]
MSTTTKRISLALQGGGTYGAFTWGVLDRLLREERLQISSLSGSSAGAINAAVVADGYARGGGREGARRALDRFWRALGGTALFSPLQRTPLDHLAGGYTMRHSPAYQMLEMAGALAGPVLEMPFTVNPLRNFLTAMIDFERVRACEEFGVYISATEVRSGRGKIFVRQEMDVQRLMASACLPTVFAAVQVEGEAYWDGSFAANPPLAPLVEHGGAQDLLVVQINPIERKEIPRSMADISNRANEIAFNTSFVREVNALLHTQAVPSEEGGAAITYAPTRLHLVTAIDFLADYSISSKFNAEPAFLEQLRERGVAAADAWLARHFDDVGLRSTLDPAAVFGTQRP